MYRVSVSTTFDAAHRLENYNGPCARLHGHTYTVTGEWERGTLDRLGIALDMVELKKQLKAVVVDMDHCHLNKIRDLAKTTAEAIAQLLFKRLSKRTPSGEFLVAVTVEETPGCSVRYSLPDSPAPRLSTLRGGHMASMPEPESINGTIREDLKEPESVSNESGAVKNTNEDNPIYQDDTAETEKTEE